MNSILEELTINITNSVISEITTKLLPLISDKYGIDLEELQKCVSSVSVKQESSELVAKPKVANKKVSKSVKYDELLAKIEKIKAGGKVLNISTGKAILDSPQNRKKLTFNDKFGIAGNPDDEKFQSAIQLLTDNQPNQNDEQKLGGDGGSPNESGEGGEQKDSGDGGEEPITSENETDTETFPISKNQVPVHKQAEQARKRAEKYYDFKKTDEEETIDTVIKMSELIEIKDTKVLKISYNSEIKKWWNVDTKFVFNKKEGGSVIGKYIDKEIVDIDETDRKICEKNGWNIY